MAWTDPNKTWVAAADLTASDMNQYVRDQLDETAPAIATAGSRLIVTDGANSIVERIPVSAFMTTSESTASTSATDLATVGPSVTVTTGTKALIVISARLENDTAGAVSICAADISGATTNSPGADEALYYESSNANDLLAASYSWMVNLNAGSNTFKLKYWVSAGTGTFRWRRIAVIPF